MEIKPNIDENSVDLVLPDSIQKIQFSHRWESCFLKLLIAKSLSSPSKPLDFQTFNNAVEKLGQKVPVTRMQMSRIIESVYKGFETAGHPDWIRHRLKYNQREKTVGPWRWQPAIPNAGSAPAPPAQQPGPILSRNIPRLTTDRQSKSIRSTLGVFLEADSLAFDGEQLRALEALQQGSVANISIAAKSLLEIRRAKWMVWCGQLDDAEELLQGLLNGTSRMPAEQSHWLRLHAQYVLLRAQYSRNPVLNAASIVRELTSMKRGPSIAPDPLLAAARSNLLSLAQRRRMESFPRSQDRLKAKKYYFRAVDSLSTALLCNLAANSYEQVQMGCVNMAYLQQKAFSMKLTTSIDEVFAWYAMAFSWNNKFNLFENSAWEFIILGELFLTESKAQERFASSAHKLHWQGLRPDQSDFYKSALRVAKKLGDPDQTIHALLNAYLFEERFGLKQLEKNYVSQWVDFCEKQPRQLEVMIMQGYKIPEALRR